MIYNNTTEPMILITHETYLPKALGAWKSPYRENRTADTMDGIGFFVLRIEDE